MSENLFGSLVPLTANASDAAPGLTLGTRIRFAVAGNISGLRWRFPDTLPSQTVPWFVTKYDPTTDLSTSTLASGTFSAPVAGQYNTVTFAPVAVNAGDEVVAEVWTPDRYVASSHLLDTDMVSGNLTGPHDEPTSTPNRRNGRFNVGAAPAFPQNGFQGSAYHVDVLFDASGQVNTTVSGRPGGYRLGGHAGSLVLGTTVAGRPGSVAYGGRAAAISGTSGAAIDPLGMPAAQAVLDCLMVELARTNRGVPKHGRITPGVEVVAALTTPINGGASVDECCEGIASVRIERIYPSAQLPDPETRVDSEGGPTAYAVVLELMVLRCGSQPGPQLAPTDAQLTGDAQAQWDDVAAMRRVGCCLRDEGKVYDFLISDAAPVASEGGCLGTTLQLTVQVGCAEC